MKSNKGITLISLVMYIIVATIVIGIMAMVSSSFYSNANKLKDQDECAVEFNKFNMFFIYDVKNNKKANARGIIIDFLDGTTYEYVDEENAIYRYSNGESIKVAENITNVIFSYDDNNEDNIINNTQKRIITVEMTVGENKAKTVEYVLKYW